MLKISLLDFGGGIFFFLSSLILSLFLFQLLCLHNKSPLKVGGLKQHLSLIISVSDQEFTCDLAEQF